MSKSHSIPPGNLFRYKGLAWLPLWLQLPVHRDVSNSIAGTGLTNNGWRLLYLGDEWYLKSCLSSEHQDVPDSAFNEHTCEGFEVLCLLTALHGRWEYSHFSWPNAEVCLDFWNVYLLLFCLSAVFTLRGTKAVWWLVWRSLIFGCFSLCFPKAGSSPQRMRDAEQSSPDALRAAKGSS